MMLAPPVECRTRNEQDEAFLFNLFIAVRGPELSLAGLPAAALDRLLRLQYASQSSSYRVQHPAADDHIVWRGEERLGRILVDRNGEALHLVDLGLLAGYRNQGVGTLLLEQLLGEARDTRRAVRLCVRHGNPAIRLYLRLGFLITGDNGMDFTMECRPSEHPNRLHS